jgi:hypothetical protein
MIKLLFFGVWGAAVAVAANIAITKLNLLPQGGSAEKPAATALVEKKKTPVVSVPVIRNGAVEGYAVFQFGYSLERNMVTGGPLAPEAIMLDEIYRIAYGDEKLDLGRTDRYDLSRLPGMLERRLAERLGPGIVKDILIQEFNYVPREKLRT